MNAAGILGIDLGTTNTAVATADVSSGRVSPQPVMQLVRPGALHDEALLPSMLYIPFAGEFEAGALALPWNAEPAYCTGQLAKSHGATNPDRLVHSAKSWLCNHHVDRHAAILPWNSKIEEAKLSPYAVSKAYLSHVREAFQLSDSPLSGEKYRTVVTVPASFDDTARALTHEAAGAAGFDDVTILEEPVAAFYAWIENQGNAWKEQVTVGDVVLVCDIGGGTADFSLIAVAEGEAGELDLVRLSVGEHILLGGDNIDLALAHTLKRKLESQGSSLDSWQFMALVHASRNAKEELLAVDAPEEVSISIASRGSSLFASTLSVPVLREEVLRLVLDGFFLTVAPHEVPQSRTGTGLREFGLDYASDPCFTRHLAAFLRNSKQTVQLREDLRGRVAAEQLADDAVILKPTAVLFNGGVCKATPVRERLLSLLTEWSGKAVRELPGTDYDRAVARGAAFFGLIRETNESLRIRSGTPYAYYIGVEVAGMPIPGALPELQGVCVVPQGMEEGSSFVLEKEFGLLTGQNVEFRFFRSGVRGDDQVGAIVSGVEHALEETSRLHLTLPPIADGENQVIPVQLRSVVTEVGTLELWMEHCNSDNRWKLEFNVRNAGENAEDTLVPNASEAQIESAQQQIEDFYGKKN